MDEEEQDLLKTEIASDWLTKVKLAEKKAVTARKHHAASTHLKSRDKQEGEKAEGTLDKRVVFDHTVDQVATPKPGFTNRLWSKFKNLKEGNFS